MGWLAETRCREPPQRFLDSAFGLPRNDKHRDKMRKLRHQDIIAVRAIMDKHRQNAEIFLGGVSMITADMIGFIKSDLSVFCIGVLCLMIVVMGLYDDFIEAIAGVTRLKLSRRQGQRI